MLKTGRNIKRKIKFRKEFINKLHITKNYLTDFTG